jgi:transposase
MVEAVLGIDVGKHKLHVALLFPGKKPKAIANTPEGHQTLLQWLQQQKANQVHACLEATSTYGEAVAEVLHEAEHRVSIVNPARIGGFAKSELTRTKTDKVDAALITRFCAAIRPSLWTPPPTAVKQLQALVRRLEALKAMQQQELNRLETATTQVIPFIEEHLKYLKQDIQRMEQLIKDHFDQHPDLKQQRDLLTSIPGIAQTTASLLLAEIVSWKAFESAKQLAAYIGLTPQERTSGSSVRGRPQLSRTGSGRLRKALYMPAVVAKRHNPTVRVFCERLAGRGKTTMQIVGAAMRKLAHIVYGVLKSNRPFDPNLTA